MSAVSYANHMQIMKIMQIMDERIDFEMLWLGLGLAHPPFASNNIVTKVYALPGAV